MPASWLRAPLSRLTGRLGQPAAGREGLEAAPGQVGRAESAQLLVGVDPGLARGGEGAAGRDRLDERHQGDPGRGNDQLAGHAQVGADEVGQAGRDGADQGHATVGQPGGGGEQDPEGDHEQRAGQRRRCPAAQPEHEGDAGQGQDEGWPVDVAQVGQGRAELDEEVAVLLGDAQDLAELAGGDQQRGAGLEAGEDGGGDDVGQEPQPQHPGQQQHARDGGQVDAATRARAGSPEDAPWPRRPR
jgi:hypothetical protein